MKTERVQIMGMLLVLVLILPVSCAPPAAAPIPSPAPQAPGTDAAKQALAVVPEAQATPAWEEEWERVLAAAKKEARLVLYTGIGGEQRQILLKPFQSEYGVQVESMSGGSSLLAPKVFAEQRTGIYSVDVWISGSTTYRELQGTLDFLEPAFIVPELTQPEVIKKTWYFGELGWADKAHTMVISLMQFAQYISTNTSLVKASEILIVS